MLKSQLVKLYRYTLKFIVGLVPKNKKLLLFSSWFGQKYSDNTMYLFEYMLKKSDYEVYWFTKNKALYEELKSQSIPVIYSQSIRGWWMQARAIMLLSTVQTSDFNQLLLNKCIFLDLDHGFPGKPVGLGQPTVNQEWKEWYYFCREGIDFYQTASSKFVVDFASPNYDIDSDHFIFSNKPRIDVLFSADLQKGKTDAINDIKKGRRAIVYLPTHRACGAIEMQMSKILDLESINSICKNTDCVFIIKKHFYHKHEKENLDRYANIIDITDSDIDTQILLSQTDILVTDFSSCYNDFLALNRPIVFYAYDYEEYLSKDRDYYWKYDKITAGYTVKDKCTFNNVINILTNDWTDAIHEDGRKAMREIYFDPNVEMGSSREKLKIVITELINGTYKPFNWDLNQ